MQRSLLIITITGLTLGLLLYKALACIPPNRSLSECLPKNLKLTDVIDRELDSPVTVEQKLRELKATCNIQGKLIDASAEEIYFYKLTGCWGNAPNNYREILQRQRDEIEKLSKSYTVVEISCNPSGIPIP